jgi:small subunit ribosomal protein S9
MTDTKDIKIKKIEEPVKFTGKFISATGKRKTAAALIRLYKNGKGAIMVNDIKINQYFTAAQYAFIHQILKQTGHLRDLNFSILVKGGGKTAQAQACVLGLARALILFDKELRLAIKTSGYLTRDARKKERKKPGLKKARKAPQWAKR